MPRFILLDNASGYIWGDTADYLANRQSDLTPIEAAEALDRHIDPAAAAMRDYEDCYRSDLKSNECGYHVYRADIGGSEAVPVVVDGQDRATIEAVERNCKYITTIRVTDRAE